MINNSLGKIEPIFCPRLEKFYIQLEMECSFNKVMVAILKNQRQ